MSCLLPLPKATGLLTHPGMMPQTGPEEDHPSKVTLSHDLCRE